MIYIIFSILLFLLCIDYAIFLRCILDTWSSRSDDNEATMTDLPFISIIIAARNEEANILRCLNSISDNNLPTDQYEIILVDDHSDDRTRELASQLKLSHLKVISLSGDSSFGKKAAIHRGVHESKGEVLLFTDADTEVPPDWISSMATHLIKNELSMVTGLVSINHGDSMLDLFQMLDVGGTMLWTGAGIWSKAHYMANGANMAVKKSAYLTHQHQIKKDITSGDDVFLIQSIARDHPDSVDFKKSTNAMVKVDAEESWSALVNQRLRWASKTTAYDNASLSGRIARIFLMNALILCGVIVGIVFPHLLLISLGALVLKVMIEAFYLKDVSSYFNIRSNVMTRMLMSIVQTIYICVIGIFTICNRRFTWKDRVG